jgi:hypothetical protein
MVGAADVHGEGFEQGFGEWSGGVPLSPGHEEDNPAIPFWREKGEIYMFARTRILQVTGMIVVLVLLAACGGVNGGTYTINANTGDWPWFWPDKAEFIVDKNVYENVPVAGQERFRVDAVNGEIAITGKPGATSVTVTAELIVGSNVSQPDAENGLNQMEIVVSELPGEILVQTVQPERLNGRQYLVKYNINVPSNLSVEVTQVNGHVTVENIENSLLVTVDDGSVHGTVSLPPGSEITLWTGKGDLDLRIPTSTSAEFSALVGFGAITWDNLDFLNVVQTDRSLTGTLGNGDGLIDLDTGNGNIDVTGSDG